MSHEIARTIEELPVLREGWMRLVHLCDHSCAEKIVDNGLDYSRHDNIFYTVRVYSCAEDAEYSHKDPRFSGSNIRAVVLDVPVDEFKKHDGTQVAPSTGRMPGTRRIAAGLVPAEYVVGIVKPEEENKSE